MNDDMDDPMSVASPRPKAMNGFDKPHIKRRNLGPGMGPDGMFDLSMNDDIIDPISVSMEMTDSRDRDDPRAQMRSSPGIPYQSDPYDQRQGNTPHYRQPPQPYSQTPSEPTWEWRSGTVRLDKMPNCGFGLAVIGGLDKPTPSGEVSIIVSDILPNGPADDKLKINDRLLMVNGVSMDNVDHVVAVGALRSAGGSVVIEYKRKVQSQQPFSKSQTLPLSSAPSHTPGGRSTLSASQSYYTPPTDNQRSHSQPPPGLRGSQRSLTNSQSGQSAARETVTLTKSRNEGFGIQLGWKLYVQGLSEYGVASSQGLNKGDTIIKINNYPVETLSLADAKRIMQTSGNSLNLEIIREPPVPAVSTPSYSPRSVERLDRLSIGAGDERDYPSPQLHRGRDYDPPQHPGDYGQLQRPRDYGQPQQSGGFKQQPPEVLPNMSGPQEPIMTYDQDDPLNASLPPRPPLPGEGQQRSNFSMPPPRPPSPGKQEFMGITDEVVEGEERLISFKKDRSIGLQVIGGNDSGVYIGRVQPNSNAARAMGPRGNKIRIGDRIVDVNGINLLGKTKEEVILLLLGINDDVHLVLRESSAFKEVLHSGIGDRFFIRAHFNYAAPTAEEMSFTKGLVFRVLDTMPEGVMGHWFVLRLDRTNVALERGIIPNENRANQLNLAHQREEAMALKPVNFEGRKGKFKRLGMRSSMRSKSIIKDHWDEIIFGGTVLKFPAYERVILREVGFSRPVVLFGAMADLVRDRLLRDMPDKFEAPLMDHVFDSKPGEPMHMCPQGSIKLHAIKDVMDKGKHCLLDVTPNAVEQLNYAQCYPIVIFLNAESRAHVKEVRGQFIGEGRENKGSRKYYQTAKKMKKHYSYVFTAMIPVNPDSMWYSQIKEAVHIQQNRKIWVSEAKLGEDFDADTTLNVIGELTLPPDYDSDAESMLTDSRSVFNDSTVESDFEPVSPSDTVKDDSFNFTEETFKKKEELPVSASVAPPAPGYSSDEEVEKPVIRASRPRHKKRSDKQRSEPRPSSKERGLLGRFPSLSRSESRGRHSEIDDDEDLEDTNNANKYNADSRVKYSDRLEGTWQPTERPSRREHMRRREMIEKEQKAKEEEDAVRAEKINAVSSQPGTRSAPLPGAVKLPQLDQPPQQGQRPVPAPKPSMAPKPSISRPTTVPPAAPASKPDPKPRVPPKETTFGLKETTFGVDDIVETSPVVTPSIKKETTFSEEGGLQWGLEFDGPSLMAMEEPPLMEAPPPIPRKPAISEPVYASVHKDRPQRSVEPPPRQDFPRSFEPYQPQERFEPPQRFEPPRRLDDSPVEPRPPVNGLSSSDDPGTSWFVEPEVVQRPQEIQESAAPAWQVESPYELVQEAREPVPEEKPPMAQPEPQIVSVKSTFLESSVQRIDRLEDWGQPQGRDSPTISAQVQGMDLSEPPSSNDYKKQMQDAFTKLHKVKVRESPRGWEQPVERESPSIEANVEPTRQDPVQAPPPPSREPPNGLSDSATSDTDKKYSNIPDGRPDAEPKKAPYERQSYKEYREAFFKRSKSPGRQYQDNLYNPKPWTSRKKENNNPASFWSIPISEDSLNADDGHEVLDTARGFFDSSGGVLSSTSTGVSIVIPKGALPQGVKQEIFFKVCRDTNMLPPLDKDKGEELLPVTTDKPHGLEAGIYLGETLLSPVVICKPHGLKFLKPVELRLPHCASMTPDGWSFNLKSSDAGSGNAPSQWENMVIPHGEESKCQVNANSVSILVDHF